MIEFVGWLLIGAGAATLGVLIGAAIMRWLDS